MVPQTLGTFCWFSEYITSSNSAVVDAVPLDTFIIVDNVLCSELSNLLYLCIKRKRMNLLINKYERMKIDKKKNN